MIDRTAEAIIVRFAGRFPPKVVEQARQRLAAAPTLSARSKLS
jgi:hypothetical protein